MNEVLISIIVPIYNSEKYLKRCIDSIIQQSQSNFEILLINDGSTDSSRNICEEYVNKYKNVRLINQENKGQAVARNLGVQKAAGKYIGFVDSDDFIDKNMYKVLLQRAEDSESDIVICRDEKVYDDANHKLIICNKNIEFKVEENSEEKIKMFLLQNISSYSCDKLFKKELIINNKIKFPEGYYFEDINFVLRCLHFSKKVSITEEKFYKYVQRNNSTTFTRNKKHLNDFYIQTMEMFKFIKENYIIDNLNLEIRNCKFIYTNMYLKIVQNIGIENYFEKYFKTFDKDLVIFGASSAGKLMFEFCIKYNINVIYFSDNNHEKWGKKFENIEIIKPKEIENLKNYSIYIASMYYKSIYEQLREYGLEDRIIDLDIL